VEKHVLRRFVTSFENPCGFKPREYVNSLVIIIPRQLLGIITIESKKQIGNFIPSR